MANEGNLYIFSRKELKSKGAFQFQEGDIVICNKYYIHIEYGTYDRPSFMTKVHTREDARYLLLRKQPYYIADFVARSPEELDNNNREAE